MIRARNTVTRAQLLVQLFDHGLRDLLIYDELSNGPDGAPARLHGRFIFKHQLNFYLPSGFLDLIP